MRNELTLQLGVGAVVWRMPSLVHRIEVMQRQAVHGMAMAGFYALTAGLPDTVADQCDMTGQPALDVHLAERLLTRQGCTVRHLTQAAEQARQAVQDWYRESMPKAEAPAQGNEEASPPDTTS